jgi:iron complex transport system ATP-binding protein
MTTNVLHIADLSHSFDDQRILKAIGMDIPTGAFYIIIGPNGSGKTTLMKIMAGILAVQDGRITIMNRPIGSYARKELARTIAYVPQLVSTDVPFSVKELVLMGRAPHQGWLEFDSPDDLQIAEEAMAITGVAHLAERRLEQLSGGEQQRVMIARAVCQQAPVILLDEPTASLDLSHQIRIMDLMAHLRNEKGVTVVMISHDINLAAMYGRQLLLLNEGRVSRTGSPREVIDPKVLEGVYGCPLVVDESPVGPYPRVTPVPGKTLR